MRTSSNRTALREEYEVKRVYPSPQRRCHPVLPISMRTPKQGLGRASDQRSGGEAINESEDGNSAARAQKLDPNSTKHRLLKILDSLINLDSQHGKVEQLILQLESLNAKPITDMFTEMALSGEWKLVFSSMRTKTDGNIRIRQIGQIFDTEKKTLTNQVLWSFPSADGTDQIRAYLWVICEYKFVGPGRLEVSISEHKVKILKREDGAKHNVPKDMQSVINTLRQALPMDFFQPLGLLDVSYIEPNFRLARFVGKRLAGVRNVFIRVGTEGHS